ncbi:MAG: hypothetical protein QXU98_12475 [Candidatus Parvarchaeota archaeon]
MSSFAEQITLYTTVKAEPPPSAPLITKYQRARTRERNRTIVPAQAVVYYMSSFAQLGVETINTNQSQLIQQFEGIPSNLTSVAPSSLNDIYTTLNSSLLPPFSTLQTLPTLQQTIGSSTPKTVIIKSVFNGSGVPILPLPDVGTILKSVSITNLDSSNPVYVNGIYVPPQQTLAITLTDPSAQLDPTTISIYNPNNVVINVVYEEEKT